MEMKRDITVEHGIKIDPKVVHSFTQARRNRGSRTDSCLDMGNGETWEEFAPPRKPVWLGCTAVLPNGKKCYGIPIYGDKCFLHSLSF